MIYKINLNNTLYSIVIKNLAINSCYTKNVRRILTQVKTDIASYTFGANQILTDIANMTNSGKVT